MPKHRHSRRVNNSLSQLVQDEGPNDEEEDGEIRIRPCKITSLGELDEAFKRHRKLKKHRYSELTQCDPCCPCYNCTNPLRQNDDAQYWPEDDAEEATDNVDLLFSHMRRNHHKSLPDRPILVGNPKFVRDFREALAEARQQSMADAFFQTLGKILLRILTFLVLLPIVPLRMFRRRRNRIGNDVSADEKLVENNEMESVQL